MSSTRKLSAIFVVALSIAGLGGCADRSMPSSQSLGVTSRSAARSISGKLLVNKDRNGKSLFDMKTSRRQPAAVTGPGQGVTDTIDVCFNGGTDDVSTFCTVQGGTMQIAWSMSPQPPDGTIISWADQPIANGLDSQDSFSPAVQNHSPYATIQTITLLPDAAIESDFRDYVSANCTDSVAAPTCDADATPEGEIGIASLCSVSLGHCPTLLIHDNELGRDVAAPNPIGTPLTVVGAPQELVTAVQQGSGSGAYGVSGTEWSLPGFDADPPAEVKSSVLSDYGASYTLLSESDMLSPQLDFSYLVGSGGILNNPPPVPVVNAPAALNSTTTVSVAALLTRSDYQEIADGAASALYNVDAPNLTVSAAETRKVQYGTFSYRTGAVPPTPVKAISVGSDVVVPATSGFVATITGTMPRSFAGSIAMAQTVNATANATPVNGQTIPGSVATFGTGQEFKADECALLPITASSSTVSPLSYSFAAGAPVSEVSAISPVFYPDPNTEAAVTVTEHLKNYVMFKPSVPNAIWVGEALLDWNWNAGLTFNTDGSANLSATDPANPLHTIQGLITQPSWNGVRRYTGRACKAIP